MKERYVFIWPSVNEFGAFCYKRKEAFFPENERDFSIDLKTFFFSQRALFTTVVVYLIIKVIIVLNIQLN
jgi:hypothetical protein